VFYIHIFVMKALQNGGQLQTTISKASHARQFTYSV